MEAPPDFVLACNGIEAACRFIDRVAALGRDDLMLASVSPAIPGPLGAAKFEEVVLAPRQAGETLFPVRAWPLAVYVCHLRPTSRGASQLEVIAWGELSQVREDCTS